MAVVVCAPHVNGLGKAAGSQLVVVVGDICGKVGGNAVGADEHLVLGLFLGAVLGLFLVHGAVLGSVLGTAVHDGTVLGLVAGTQLQQLVHHSHHCAGLVQGALMEPHIIVDAVLAQVALEGGDVLGQGIGHQSVLQLCESIAGKQGLFVHTLAGGNVLVAVDLGELPGQHLDVAALIALGGQRIGFLAAELLQVAHRQTFAELLDLVAGVVDIELAGHIVAGPVQHSGQTVAQRAAAGVAHVHGTGGVGRNELHVVLCALAVVGAAILLVGAGTQHNTCPEALGQEQVDEAGTGNLHFGEHAVLKGRQMCQQGVCDHLGSLAPSACTGHGEVGGDIAVFHVGGDLHDKGRQFCFGQGAVCHSSLGGCGQQSACLVQCSLPGVVVLVGLFKISHGSDSFHSLRELHQFTWVTVISSRLRLTSSALSASSR